MRLVGIDGCRGGWIAAVSHEDFRHLQFEILDELSSVFDRARRGEDRIVIDIPIGLPDSQRRDCDIAARKILSRRHKSSVFPAPPRCTLRACGPHDYAVACQLSFSACGKSLSRQAFGILPKIRQVDDLIDAGLQAEGVREAHPEVTFACLAGHSLQHSKKTTEGERERLELLTRVGIELDVAKVRKSLGPGDVARDDVIDAASCLIVAQASWRQALRLFPSAPCLDARGLRMEIVAPTQVDRRRSGKMSEFSPASPD